MSEPKKSSLRVSPVILIIVVFTLLGIVAILTVTLINQRQNPAQETNDVAIVDPDTIDDGITEVDPPKPLADFTLTSTSGTPVQFSDYTGQWRLIYFGYTHCPDFCPTTLLSFQQIKAEMGTQADHVTFMMVSVDGERDNPEAMATYLGRFDPDFVGLTGTIEEITPVTQDFGVFFEKHVNPGSEFYGVDHTVSVFVVNPEDELVALYDYGTDTGVIVDDLKARLATE